MYLIVMQGWFWEMLLVMHNVFVEVVVDQGMKAGSLVSQKFKKKF